MRAQQCCLEAIRQGIVSSAHDCSDGGLAVTLAESCIAGVIGFKGEWEASGRLDTELFGEGQSRIVLSLNPGKVAELETLAASHDIPIRELGRVTGDRLSLADISDAWHNGLERALG